MDIRIISNSITCAAPDEDGDCSLRGKVQLAVSGSGTVDVLEQRTVIWRDGAPVKSDLTEHEDLELEEGDEERFEMHTYGLDYRGAKGSIFLTGYTVEHTQIGEGGVPLPGEMNLISQKDPGLDGLVVRGWSVRTEKPDSDGDCWVYCLVALENTSSRVIHKAQVRCSYRSRKDKELSEDYDDARHLMPGSTRLVEVSAILKERAVRKSMTVRLTLETWKLAAEAKVHDLPIESA